MTAREGVLLRGSGAGRATPLPRAVRRPAATADRGTPLDPRAADLPVVGGGASFRLGDVYAEELARLREHAHAEGFTAGHAEGMAAAAASSPTPSASPRSGWPTSGAGGSDGSPRRPPPSVRPSPASTRHVPAAGRGGPRHDPRHRADARGGPGRTRARPRRGPGAGRRAAGAGEVLRPTRRPSSACTPTTSRRSRPRRSPSARIASGWSPIATWNAPVPSPRPVAPDRRPTRRRARAGPAGAHLRALHRQHASSLTLRPAPARAARTRSPDR